MTVGNAEIGVFNLDGSFHAMRNRCPHEGAPLCTGELTGTTRATATPHGYDWIDDGRVLRCPWHGWEFRVDTGDCMANGAPSARRVQVEVRDGDVYVVA